MKTYLISSIALMVVCIIVMAAVMMSPMPKSGRKFSEQLILFRIIVVIYMIIGTPAVILGVPYLVSKLF